VSNTDPFRGGNYENKFKDALGHYRADGMLRYRDFDGGYCRVCQQVFNVTCPNCKAKADKHGHDNEIFLVEHPLTTDRAEGWAWTLTTCRKCDYKMKVIVF
jgi:predicted amidophosphoribosyltransferase